MTSKPSYSEGYVWIWLPGEVDPVVAGKLEQQGAKIVFNYGQSYLKRDNAIPIYEKELPLKPGLQESSGSEPVHGCLRDSAPDAWGRRVILNKLLGSKGKDADTADLGELMYLMESGSDRIGALDFQGSPTEYIPRLSSEAKLEDLLKSAELVEKGVPLNEELAQALNHGTSIGGARPKATLEGDGRKYIAKFSSSTDVYNVIKAEFVAMKLAALCGLNVASVDLASALGKDILLIERFDRVHAADDKWQRKLMLSALTLLGLNEMAARYASYQDFAEIIRYDFKDPKDTLEELFSRLVFNILCGNTDDHARNHAAFWDGKTLKLTPAYDICPQHRMGEEASQAMLISESDRSSRIITALSAAHHFLLDKEKAKSIVEAQVDTINSKWDQVAQEAELTDVENTLFKTRLFLRPYAFEGYESKD